MADESVTINAKKSWKKLDINVTSYGEGLLDGFLGIEELTDYEIIKHEPPTTADKASFKKSKLRAKSRQTIKRKKASKPKSASTDESPSKKIKAKDESQNTTSEANNCETSETTNNTTCEANSATKLCDLESKYEETVANWQPFLVPDPVLKALTDLGFTTPTTIQRLTLLSAIRDRKDIVGAAETGSGKTLAFGIPIIHHILRNKEEEMLDNNQSELDNVENSRKPNFNTHLRGLIITPTRELAIQIKDHLVAVAKYTNIKFAVVVGGLSREKQCRILKRKPDIIIGTPGRLCELIEEKESYLSKLSLIKYLVIDEADRLLEKGHFEGLTTILDHIKRDESASAARQTFVFSATLTLVPPVPLRVLKKKKKIIQPNQNTKLEGFLTSIGVKDGPKIVDITRKLGTVETLTEARINCTHEEKDYFLYYFLTRYPGRTLVFCNSIDCVRRLQSIFHLLHKNIWPLHATMHQRQRLKNLERFTANPSGVLLATDVAARGLDIPNVAHVIHYQVPRTSEQYIHRSGRTARALKEGLSVMFIDSREVAAYHRICKTLNRNEQLPVFPVDLSLLKEVKVRVCIAQEIDKLDHKMRKRQSQNNWFSKASKDIDMELEKDELLKNMDDDYYEQAAMRKQMKYKQKQLDNLLKIPISPAFDMTRYPASGMNVESFLSQYSANGSALALMKKEVPIQEKLLQGFLSKSKTSKKNKHRKKK